MSNETTPAPAQRPGYAGNSWLGRWRENGWAIRITPKLSEDQWRWLGLQSDQMWDAKERKYTSEKCEALLRSLFPDRELAVIPCLCDGPHPHPRSKEQK